MRSKNREDRVNRFSLFRQPSHPMKYILLLSVILSSYCSPAARRAKLNPHEDEFLSKVRYIVTKKERKIFRELKITDAQRRVIASHTKDYVLSLAEKQLIKKMNDGYPIDIPLLLGEGDYSAWISLQNSSSGEELKKKFDFSIKKNSVPKGKMK